MSLCLIAGQGRLPHLLIDGARIARVAALEGFAPEGLTVDRTFRIERLGSFLSELREAGIDRVCLAGAIRRPAVDPARIDAATAPLVPRLMAAMQQGDDTVLRVVLDIFSQAGLTPVAAHDLLPGLLPGRGVLAGEVGPASEADAQRAEGIVRAMGTVDIGQSCVVAQGQALGVEGLAGTDWMLRVLAAARSDGALSAPLPPGGLLYKAPKPGQDRRVDMPTIGPDTVRNAMAAGLEGIVIAADGVLLLDAEETLSLARAAGLFLWVRHGADG